MTQEDEVEDGDGNKMEEQNWLLMAVSCHCNDSILVAISKCHTAYRSDPTRLTTSTNL